MSILLQKYFCTNSFLYYGPFIYISMYKPKTYTTIFYEIRTLTILYEIKKLTTVSLSYRWCYFSLYSIHLSCWGVPKIMCALDLECINPFSQPHKLKPTAPLLSNKNETHSPIVNKNKVTSVKWFLKLHLDDPRVATYFVKGNGVPYIFTQIKQFQTNLTSIPINKCSHHWFNQWYAAKPVPSRHLKPNLAYRRLHFRHRHPWSTITLQGHCQTCYQPLRAKII